MNQSATLERSLAKSYAKPDGLALEDRQVVVGYLQDNRAPSPCRTHYRSCQTRSPTVLAVISSSRIAGYHSAHSGPPRSHIAWAA